MTAPALPDGWTLTASAFNWTPAVIRAEDAAPEIAARIVAEGIAAEIEVELGQLWRSFPAEERGEAEALRGRLAEAGGRVSIVGGSIDDWDAAGHRRTDQERADFLVPQLRTAHHLGARGLRLPIGQAGPVVWERVLPVLHELDLVLYEEAQGQQTPSSPGSAAAYDALAALADPHVRLLVDISMLMPALPVTYLERLRAGGVPAALLDRLATEWRDPATLGAVVDLLRSGGVPPEVHTMYMNLLVRFGRSDASELRDVLPFAAGMHVKFWDLDDTDGRVSRPIEDIGAELARAGFTGTLTSEWGGHEWLDDDPAAMTRAHLALTADALARGVARA